LPAYHHNAGHTLDIQTTHNYCIKQAYFSISSYSKSGVQNFVKLYPVVYAMAEKQLQKPNIIKGQ
jgi:hypothetical protein